MDREVRLCLAVSCEKYSDEKKYSLSAIRVSATRAQPLALKIISVGDATKTFESNGSAEDRDHECK